MVIWALAKKEFRLLSRDRLSAVILLGMPLLFILILGLLLGEGFGRKPDDRLRVSLVNEDRGYAPRRAAVLVGFPATGLGGALGAVTLEHTFTTEFRDWSDVVRRDLAETASIRVEMIGTREEARRLVSEGRRSAVMIFGPAFSERVHRCSFIGGGSNRALGLVAGGAAEGSLRPGQRAEGINPFYRDGVDLSKLDAEILKAPAQVTASSIIEQVGQVSLLRVVLPWMIGKAFDRLSDPAFINRLGKEVNLPVPERLRLPLGVMMGKFGAPPTRVTLQEMLDLASGKDRQQAEEYRQKVGLGVKRALQGQFAKYNLTGKTWASLTRSVQREGAGAGTSHYHDESGRGWLRRGAARYQILVPSYTVLFAFTLVLPVGWLFVMERRQGTVKRLRAAPVTRGEVLVGKFLPCLLVSLFQGVLLLLAGKLVFGMSWGPETWSVGKQLLALAPVVLATSLAAMGLALFVAALARTEIQVALVGGLLVLVLGLLSGCLVPRELLPEGMVEISRITPHAWALDAYRQLLVRPEPGAVLAPNLEVVRQGCLVLTGFGSGFMVLAWGLLRLD
jgi:linearmycin/streptolysin S transport system permease protein